MGLPEAAGACRDARRHAVLQPADRRRVEGAKDGACDRERLLDVLEELSAPVAAVGRKVAHPGYDSDAEHRAGWSAWRYLTVRQAPEAPGLAASPRRAEPGWLRSARPRRGGMGHSDTRNA